MIPAAARPEFQPLACAGLRERLPHLQAAMDSEVMRVHLQRCFSGGGEAVVEACGRPRAELSDGRCTLQYPLQLRTAAQQRHSAIAHSTMFAEAGAAAEFERVTLFPQVAEWRADLHPSHPVTGVIDELNVAVSLLPVNAALPTLPEVTDPVRVTPVVAGLLGDANAVVEKVELVVFRRTRGCVVRLHVQAAGHSVLYGKVGYSAASSEARTALDTLAQDACGDAGSLFFLPHYIGRSDDLELTLVAAMPGGRPDLRTQADVTVDAAGRLAALLHRSRVTAGGFHALSGEVERASHAVDAVRADAPLLAQWLTEALALAGNRSCDAPDAAPVFSHGDFTPSQLMLDGDRAGVLDFDKLCQAEPAFDLGRFLSYLRCGLHKHANTGRERLAARFLEAYAATGAPMPAPVRIAGYELASLVRMAARSWLQLKPARLMVVCAVLEERLANLG